MTFGKSAPFGKKTGVEAQNATAAGPTPNKPHGSTPDTNSRSGSSEPIKSIKPARIAGKIPEGYSGPLYYRLSDFLEPYKSKKDLFDYLKFPKPNGPELVRDIGFLYVSDAINSPHYRDQNGRVKEQWAKPVIALARTNYKADWPEFSHGGTGASFSISVTLISERVKKTVEKYEKDSHAFVEVDVRSDAGDNVARAHIMVRGEVIDAFDPSSCETRPNILIPDGNFCCLHGELIKGRHHFWEKTLGHVWSEEMVHELGDILPRQTVYVPVGVTATSMRAKIGKLFRF